MRVSGSSGISNVPLSTAVLDKSATSEGLFFDVKAALEELEDPYNFDKIEVVEELLRPEYQFCINDYIDFEHQFRLLDIGFAQKDEALVCHLINRGARLNLCAPLSQACSLYETVKVRLSVFSMSTQERFHEAVQSYDLQLSESIDSFNITSQTAEWDTGQASAPTITKLMSACAEVLVFLPKKQQVEWVVREHQAWKGYFPPIDRSFVIALGNRVMDVFQPQSMKELNCEYKHRTKLRSVYETVIQVVAPSLKNTYREELKNWVRNYLVVEA